MLLRIRKARSKAMSVIGPILVFLAGGVQGAAVVCAACGRGHTVRALVRSASNAMRVSGVEVAVGDLDCPDSLAAACAGIAHVVLQVPTSDVETMVHQAGHAVTAAKAAGVRSIILKLASASRQAPCDEPSFVANAAVEDVVRQSGIPFAIVRPTLYLDNLLKPSARADIMHRGVFAAPIAADQFIAWTSADDCAEAAILLLERGGYGSDHRIAGAESVTGAELAARISTGLGLTICYFAQPVDDFEREVGAAIGPVAARMVASKFRYFRNHPADTHEILARPYHRRPPLADFTPGSIEDWARRNAADFRSP
jgi:uncharacterized protein YbjT (DUF2867 family)